MTATSVVPPPMSTTMLGKYVLRMLGPWLDAAGQGKATSRISEAFLRENGF